MQKQLESTKPFIELKKDQPERASLLEDQAVETQEELNSQGASIGALPTPEEVFRVKRVGLEEMFMLILGPSVIALGLSIGANAWLRFPLLLNDNGFQGIGWVIVAAIILQVFYNVELARYTMATGEAPITAFGRIRLGKILLAPIALLLLFMTSILGDWVVEAGAGLFALTTGRPHLAEELQTVRSISIGLLAAALMFVVIGRKIERTFEAFHAIYLPYIILGLLMITVTVVPFSFWGQSLGAIFIPTAPPRGTEITLLGQLASISGLAFGLNFLLVSYYRDKGYGMGSKTGYLSGLVLGHQAKLSPTGNAFQESDQNTATWKRWFRILLIDQWGIYFPILLIGSILPSILITYLASLPGAAIPNPASIITYAAQELGKKYGTLLSGWMLISGFIILFSSMTVVLELMVRGVTDAAFTLNTTIRRWVRDDARWIYYSTLFILIVVISIMINLDVSSQLRSLTGAFANAGALIFPVIMIFLNRKLPEPARSKWWSYVALVIYALFFGVLFINLVIVQFTGAPLFRF